TPTTPSASPSSGPPMPAIAWGTRPSTCTAGWVWTATTRCTATSSPPSPGRSGWAPPPRSCSPSGRGSRDEPRPVTGPASDTGQAQPPGLRPALLVGDLHAAAGALAQLVQQRDRIVRGDEHHRP